MIAAAANQKIATTMTHIPTEIYQEIASYLYKADVDNLRLTCTTASNVFISLPMKYVAPTRRRLDGYYRCVTTLTCMTVIPDATSNIRSVHLAWDCKADNYDLERIAHVHEFTTDCTITIPSRIPNIYWPNLKKFAFIPDHSSLMPDVKKCEYYYPSYVYNNAPNLTHLYLSGTFRPEPGRLKNLRVLRAIVNNTRNWPESIRVLVYERYSCSRDLPKGLPALDTFIGDDEQPMKIVEACPTVSEIIVPRGYMWQLLPHGHRVTRVCVYSIDKYVELMSLNDGCRLSYHDTKDYTSAAVVFGL